MDVAMIYRGEVPHPAHRGFANAINADLLGLDRFSLPFKLLRHSIPEEIVNGAFLPDYDIYIAEGTRALYGAITRQIIGDSTLIYLAGDQALYKLTSEYYNIDSTLNKFISHYGIWALRWLFEQYIDGVIAVSEFSAQYTSRILPDKPMRVANPYIEPGLFEELGDIYPKLSGKCAVTVGAFDRYKGQDMLVTSWPKVREEHPNAELLLVGSGYPKKLEDTQGIHILGYVDNLAETLTRASLYVQPSRVDNFPVSVLEAMRAGLPPIVTTTTGNKSEVAELSRDLISEPTPQGLSMRISDYFDRPVTYRRSLSRSARQLGSEFNEDIKKHEFRSEFQDLITKL
jgi:glycosyltransferase involved in cell wall biosynthesis